MNMWLALLVPSALTGVCLAYLIRKKWAIFLAAGLPWLGLLACLIYTVYLAPGHDGGDGFWIIAQLVGGTIAAFTGGYSFLTTYRFLEKRKDRHSDLC